MAEPITQKKMTFIELQQSAAALFSLPPLPPSDFVFDSGSTFTDLLASDSLPDFPPLPEYSFELCPTISIPVAGPPGSKSPQTPPPLPPVASPNAGAADSIPGPSPTPSPSQEPCPSPASSVQPTSTPSPEALQPAPSPQLPANKGDMALPITPPVFDLHPSVALYTFDAPTHAERNPLSAVQPVRTLKALTDGQKATQKIRRQAEHEVQEQLSQEFDLLLGKHRKETEDLACRFGKKVEYLDQLVATSKHYRSKRGVNLENAKIHAKSQEVNADRAVGNKIKLPEIRQMVKEDPAFQNLSKEVEDELRGELVTLRDQKRVGARPTNRSAAQDYRRQLEGLNEQISALFERTGAAGVCFFTRTHMEDTFEPTWVCSPNASNFAQDTLGHSMWDISRLFEQWACSKAKIQSPDSLPAMRTECSQAINGGLKMAAQSTKAIMNYPNYELQVIQRHHVKLAGWTFNKFVSPFDIHTVDDLRTLRDALRCGSCHWIRLTKMEMKKHATEMAAREAAGETIGKKRKQRSDKGKKKGPNAKPGAHEERDSELDEDEGSEDEEPEPEAGPSKRRRTLAASSAKSMTKSGNAPMSKSAGNTKKVTKGAGKGKVPANPVRKATKSQLPPSKEFIDNSDLDMDDD